MATQLNACESLPENLKSIRKYFDIAKHNEDSSLSYWCELYALRKGFHLQKGKEDLAFLLDLMNRLAKKKEELISLKTVSDLNASREHIENLTLKHLNDIDAKFQLEINKSNTIIFDAEFNQFNSAGELLEVCSLFGELSEELAKKKKYVNLCKTVNEILNGFAPSNLQLAAIQTQDFETEEELALVAKLIHAKAINEPISSPIYAEMCLGLSTKEVPSASNPSEMSNFRKILLAGCQKEFENDKMSLFDYFDTGYEKEEENFETEELKTVLEFKFENILSDRRKSLGNIRFIGELFKIRLVSVKIMRQCILRCLSKPEDEDWLERLCVLLTTIGKELECPTPLPAGKLTKKKSSVEMVNRETMNSYFSTLSAIVKNEKLPEHILSKVQDLIDLRQNGWSIVARQT